MKAPNRILERLGVRILDHVESDEPYNLMSADLVWGEPTLFGCLWDFLARNYDGRLFLFRNLELSEMRIHKWIKPMSQRQALKWAVWNIPRNQSNAFKMLGVNISDL